MFHLTLRYTKNVAEILLKLELNTNQSINIFHLKHLFSKTCPFLSDLKKIKCVSTEARMLYVVFVQKL